MRIRRRREDKGDVGANEDEEEMLEENWTRIRCAEE